MEADRFRSFSQQDSRIARILAAAVDAVEPRRIVADYLTKCALPPHDRILLLGLGKAAEPMTLAAADTLDNVAAALVITKHVAGKRCHLGADSGPIKHFPSGQTNFTVMEAGHPLPDERSLAAGRSAIRFVSSLGPNDLLVCLISGGASALAAVPVEGVSIRDLQALTDSLLSSGASIQEINVLRRQLDSLKGGGLAAATPARVLSLILSDVIGDLLEAIGSGPTAPNPTTSSDAAVILKKYGVRPPDSIGWALNSRQRGRLSSTFDRVQNVIVANNRTATEAAGRQSRLEGFSVEISPTPLEGDAGETGRRLADALAAASKSRPRPFCRIYGGETTVTLRHHGKGGRNQELALAAVDALDGIQDVLLISLATDGNDGPTDAAGAVVNGATRDRAKEKGMAASAYLARHDAYPFFDSLGDLLKPGYTSTNVNDLMLLVGL